VAKKPIKNIRSTTTADDRIGDKIRLRRVELKVSQAKLGYAIGVSFQQIQKYEKGVNRVGAHRLEQIAAVLDLPVSYFYDVAKHGDVEAESLLCLDPKFSLRMLRAYSKIMDQDVAHQLVVLIEGIAG
jgi:transcriptional regulator with XRE-family HTH domain